MPDESSSSSSSSVLFFDSSSSSSSSSGQSGGGGGTGGGGRPRRNPALPNQAILDELLKAESIALKAQKLDYAPLLIEREITAAFLADIFAKIVQARAQSALATDKTTDKFGQTDLDRTSKAALMKCLKEMQKAAKQKFRTVPARLQDYYIGERIEQNRARLEQLGEQIIAKAAADALPGIKPAKITAANEALAAYKAAEGGQSAAQSQASGTRGSLSNLMKEITNARITIQLAADAEWPHENAANAGVRQEFQLPTDRAFKG
jgi:hypothetical protein